MYLIWQKGTEAQTLKCGNYKKIQMGFCANDQYLVTYDDSEMITLWDISEGKILMKEEYDSKTSIESLYTNGSGWYFGVGFMDIHLVMRDLYFRTDAVFD